MEPEQRRDNHRPPARQPNWNTIALVGGLLVLILLIAYFASSRNPDQDKLTNPELGQPEPVSAEKRCAGKSTYDFIKRELFRRAAQLRGSDQAAYDKLAAYATLRVENPVMESEDSATEAVNCSASVALDLPPGVAVVGGRRTLTSDLDFTVQPAADGSGMVVLLRNADAIVSPLATLARVTQAAPAPAEPADTNEIAPDTAPDPLAPLPQPTPQPASPPPNPRPSFDCNKARTRGEVGVCSNPGLAALDRTMAAQYARALARATPDERRLLQQTRDRFLTYRDRCPDIACMSDAYTGRVREIRDIMEGRWQPR